MNRTRALILLAALGLAVSPAPPVGAGERLLGAPVFDHASETTHRQITWDDFKGRETAPRGPNRWGQRASTALSTEVRVGRFKAEITRQGEGWLARPAEAVRPYAVMHKDTSSMKPGLRDSDTLSHEQLHFDLAEATARRIAVALMPLEGLGASRQEAGEDLTRKIRERYDADIEELWELQARYDHETENGQRSKKQKQWAQKVSEMFRQASEALAAALDAGSGPVDAEQ